MKSARPPLIAPSIVRLVRGMAHQKRGIAHLTVCASSFGVSDRTWLRWEKDGVPKFHGRSEHTRSQWRAALKRAVRELDRLNLAIRLNLDILT